MKKFILFFLLGATTTFAQFDIEAYKEYLNSHKDMSVEGLLQEYPAGNFLSDAPTDFMNSEYADSISLKFALTDYEKSLINKHGFMVTERLNYPTFIHAFWDVFKKDMPVYLSSEAILHALHFNFDNILIMFEESSINNNLQLAIQKMKNKVYWKGYFEYLPDIYKKAFYDLDVYLTVTQKLLLDTSSCLYPENDTVVNEIMNLIKQKNPVEYSLFSETPRLIDFSQFTPRGHYTRNQGLKKYFSAMIWLGRTEILITNPKNEPIQNHSEEDLQRMAVLSALIAEIAVKSGADENWENIEGILSFLLGRSDNINLSEIISTMKVLSYDAEDLCNKNIWGKFTVKILELNSAQQLYNSQILFSDPDNPEQVVPPTAFLLMGQRPIIDGFITANTVYDRIIFKGDKVMRMVPSTLDILFSLGNDASIQLMVDEITKYPYSSNLAALRYLIDSYEDDFWKSNLYTCWLNGIKSLNPPLQRGNLPPFMQTAAWWQKTMNTQLASWSELRHDFLLYAKQPYTYSYMCSYPHVYIEPNPEFYENIKTFFESLKNLINSDYCKNMNSKNTIINLSDIWIQVCGNLKSMSEKILNKQEFSKEDEDFLCSILKEGSVCSSNDKPENFGWYLRLYYGLDPGSFALNYLGDKGLEADKFVVADVHTIPMDEFGNEVGWVLHAGTGRINMAVITAPTPEGGTRSYIGPVYSYYEFISNDFKRLTNEEWREMDGAPAYRPAFTNLYLADKSGNNPVGKKVSLFSVPSSVKEELPANENYLNLNCYPNPFSNSTVISFTINKEIADKIIELNIYDLSGNLVKSLINQKLIANNYSIVWDGLDNQNKKAAPGTYIYSIKVGDKVQSGKVNLVR